MSEEDKIWLKEEFPKSIKRILRGPEVNAYYKAEMLLNGWTAIRRRGCSCELGGMKQAVEQAYKKWLQNEDTISNG